MLFTIVIEIKHDELLKRLLFFEKFYYHDIIFIIVKQIENRKIFVFIKK
jgi:hypothetical protein